MPFRNGYEHGSLGAATGDHLRAIRHARIQKLTKAGFGILNSFALDIGEHNRASWEEVRTTHVLQSAVDREIADAIASVYRLNKLSPNVTPSTWTGVPYRVRLCLA